MSSAVTLKESYEITTTLRAALNNGGFHVQAGERDGLDEERLTVSYGGDDGPWFELIAYFDIKQEVRSSVVLGSLEFVREGNEVYINRLTEPGNPDADGDHIATAEGVWDDTWEDFVEAAHKGTGR